MNDSNSANPQATPVAASSPPENLSVWKQLRKKRIAYLTLPLLVMATITEIVILATGWKYQQKVCLPPGMGVTFFGIGPIGATMLAVELLKLPLAIWTASRIGWTKGFMLVIGLPLICVLTFQLVKDMAVYEMTTAMTPATHLLEQATAEEVKIAHLQGELAAIDKKRSEREKKLSELAANQTRTKAELEDALKRNEASRQDAISLTEYPKKELSEVETRQATIIQQFNSDTEQLTKAIADLRARREAEFARSSKDSADWEKRKAAYDSAYNKWHTEEARIDNAYQTAVAEHTNQKAAYEKAKVTYEAANALKRKLMHKPVDPGVPPVREANKFSKPDDLDGRPSALIAEIDAQIKAKEAELLTVNNKRRDRVAQVDADARRVREEFDRRSTTKREEIDRKHEELLAALAALVQDEKTQRDAIDQEFASVVQKTDSIRAEIDTARKKAEGYYDAREQSIRVTQVHRIATTVEILRGLIMGERPASIKNTPKERGDILTDQISMVRIWVYPILAFIVAFLPTLMVEIGFSTVFEPEQERKPHRVGFFGQNLHRLYIRAGRQKILRAERAAREATAQLADRDRVLAETEQALAEAKTAADVARAEANAASNQALVSATAAADEARAVAKASADQALAAAAAAADQALLEKDTELQAARQALAAASNRHNEQLHRIQTDHADQVNRMTQEHAGKVSRIQQEVADHVSRLEQEYTAQIKRMDQDHTEQVKRLEQERADQVSRMEQQHAEESQKQEQAWVAKLAATADSLNRAILEKDALRDLQKSEIERQIQMRQNAWSDRITQLRQELDTQRNAAEAERTTLMQEHHQKLMEVTEDCKNQVIQARRQIADAELAAVEKSAKVEHDLKEALLARDEAEAQLKQQGDALSRQLSQTQEEAARELEKAARQEKHRLEHQQLDFQKAMRQREDEFERRLKSREQELELAFEARISEEKTKAEQVARDRVEAQLKDQTDALTLKLSQAQEDAARELEKAARQEKHRLERQQLDFQKLLRQHDEDAERRFKQREQEIELALEARLGEEKAKADQHARLRQAELQRDFEARALEVDERYKQELQQREEAAQFRLKQREQQLLAQSEARLRDVLMQSDQELRRRQLELEHQLEAQAHEANMHLKQELQQKELAAEAKLKQRDQDLAVRAAARETEIQTQWAADLRTRQEEWERQTEARFQAAQARFNEETQQREELFLSRSRQRDQQWQAKLDALRAEFQTRPKKSFAAAPSRPRPRSVTRKSGSAKKCSKMRKRSRPRPNNMSRSW